MRRHTVRSCTAEDPKYPPQTTSDDTSLSPHRVVALRSPSPSHMSPSQIAILRSPTSASSLRHGLRSACSLSFLRNKLTAHSGPLSFDLIHFDKSVVSIIGMGVTFGIVTHRSEQHAGELPMATTAENEDACHTSSSQQCEGATALYDHRLNVTSGQAPRIFRWRLRASCTRRGPVVVATER